MYSHRIPHFGLEIVLVPTTRSIVLYSELRDRGRAQIEKDLSHRAPGVSKYYSRASSGDWRTGNSERRRLPTSSVDREILLHTL